MSASRILGLVRGQVLGALALFLVLAGGFAWALDGSGVRPKRATVPDGAVAFFTSPDCPRGWSELAKAEGRYLVGLQDGAAPGKTVGTELEPLENRAVGTHDHAVIDSGHTHQFDDAAVGLVGVGQLSNIERGTGARTTTLPDRVTKPGFTGIDIGSSGDIAGTNAPYLQLRACKKN